MDILTVGGVELLVEEGHAGEGGGGVGRCGGETAGPVPLRGTDWAGGGGQVGQQQAPGGVQHVALSGEIYILLRDQNNAQNNFRNVMTEVYVL